MTRAFVDFAVEVLPAMLPMIPQTMRLIGSLPSPSESVVRLEFDVSVTGLAGGHWTGTVRVDGASQTVTFGPN